MRITSWNAEPLHQISFNNARSGGGTEVVRLEITVATVDRLPVAAVALAADLQGRERIDRLAVGAEPPLLGQTLARDLVQLGELGQLPDAFDMGVILAGDMWADPRSKKRGGLGDVAPVWNAFGRSFRWVTGVLGNHDALEQARYGNQHLLDGQIITLNDLRIGGVGGIIGNEGKPGRKSQDDFLLRLYEVLAEQPDIVVLHMGPDCPTTNMRGSEVVRQAIEEHPPTLVVCGHCHADEPLHELKNGTQVVNVDGRAIILRAENQG